MEKTTNSNLSTFKIVFINQVIEIKYNIFSKEYKIQKIESLIKEVLDHIAPKPLHKVPKDYILFCYCGKQLDHQKLLSDSICSHEYQEEYSIKKNINSAYLLIEKEEDDEEKIEKINKEYKKNEINKIFKKMHEIQNIFSKKENIIYKLKVIKGNIKEYLKQKERGDKILAKSFEIYYNEEYYKDLIEIGFNKNKIKASLRYTRNDKEKAVFICIDTKYLFYDNKDVLTKENFKELCYEEILKELPHLKGKEELDNLFIHLIREIKNNKD